MHDMHVFRINRKIALLTDNAPTHMIKDADLDEEHGFKVINLSNIKIIFLPANTTSVVQPLDQGIIAALKAHYRLQLVQWSLNEASKPERASEILKKLQPSFYQMLQWVHSAWTHAVAPQTIRNCWHKAGILPDGWVDAPLASRSARRAQAQRELAGAALPQEDAEQPVSDPLTSLANAMDEFQLAAEHNSSWPQGETLLSATEYVELQGEREVLEELSDDQIVAMVQTANAEILDSDEDATDDYIPPSMSVAEAREQLDGLHEYAVAMPHLFCQEHVLALRRICDALGAHQQRTCKQTSMTTFFSAS
jgi:hypothetical protein